MKKLVLSLSIIIAAVALVACSKDKGGGNANPGYSGYYPNGPYGTTPNDPSCANGYPGYPYQSQVQPLHGYGNYANGYNGAYVGGYIGGSVGYPNQNIYPGNPQYPGYPNQNINCIPNSALYGGNPYFMYMNNQWFLGTCDFRFQGRGPLCPPGYTCQPGFGSMGTCMRGY